MNSFDLERGLDDDVMVKRTLQAAARLLLELCILIPASMLVGFSIGTAQHYVAFGVRGDGFSREAFAFAALEGGFLGWLAGIPTGIITYYAILRRQLDARILAYTVGGSLVGGCLPGLIFYWPSAGLTPFLTMAIAAAMRHKEQGLKTTSVS